MGKLKNTTVVITGGAMGIGFATARRILADGGMVTVWDINAAALADARRELEAVSDAVFCHGCDITDEEDVRKHADIAQQEMGRVDILINNAGAVKVGRFCSRPPSDWEALTRVNLVSMYYTIHAFLPEMYQRNSGQIINISSGAGLTGLPDLAVYCATKWAVYGLTESLRLEGLADRKKGVVFTSVHPGILKKGMFEGSRMNWLGELLLPRIETHDDIAKIIVNRGIKKKRHVVIKPWTLYLGPIVRGLFPDILLNKLLLLVGSARSMQRWTGRPPMDHRN